ILTSSDEMAALAKTKRDNLESEWVSIQRKEDEDREAARSAALAKARVAFAQEAQAARELVLKYDFKGALQKLKTLRDGNMSDELRPRVERRVAEMERCARFKESLLNAIKNRATSGFKADFDAAGGALEGTIEDA